MPEYWWGDRTIPIVSIDGALYALAGWDGEKYKHCWKVDPEDHSQRLGSEKYVITPVIAPEPKKSFSSALRCGKINSSNRANPSCLPIPSAPSGILLIWFQSGFCKSRSTRTGWIMPSSSSWRRPACHMKPIPPGRLHPTPSEMGKTKGEMQMTITGFCPMIVTKDQESVVQVFEALGFERRHRKTDIEGGANVAVAMKDASGNRISIASASKDRPDITGIQINVDNFQEAYDFFIGKGFIDPRGDKTTVTSSDQATMLFAPSGFPVVISEHFKDHN